MDRPIFERRAPKLQWRPDDLILQAVALMSGLLAAALCFAVRGIDEAVLPQPMWLLGTLPVVAAGMLRHCNAVAITLGAMMAALTTLVVLTIAGVAYGAYLLYKLFTCLPGWGSC